MTHFIPRAKMPQVDEKDMPRMLADASKDIGWEFGTITPNSIASHQYVNHKRAVDMPLHWAIKPILVSSDNAVLDGNHRLYSYRWWNGDHKEMIVIRLNLPFEEALDWLLHQEYTYTINPHTHERN